MFCNDTSKEDIRDTPYIQNMHPFRIIDTKTHITNIKSI